MLRRRQRLSLKPNVFDLQYFPYHVHTRQHPTPTQSRLLTTLFTNSGWQLCLNIMLLSRKDKISAGNSVNLYLWERCLAMPLLPMMRGPSH